MVYGLFRRGRPHGVFGPGAEGTARGRQDQPQHLSVRNVLAGVITAVTGDDADTDLIAIDIGGTLIMARVTKAATRDLGLKAGLPAWALVKSVSLRGHSFTAPATR